MELDDLLTEYHAKQDYGAMMACLLKPALYVLQCIGDGSSSKSGASAASAGEAAGTKSSNNGSSRLNGNSSATDQVSFESWLYTEQVLIIIRGETHYNFGKKGQPQFDLAQSI